MPTCDHCLLEFPESRSVRAKTEGGEKVFCCHACLGVYELIHSEHLEDFYRKRSRWSPGPALTVAPDPSAFGPSIRPAGEDLEVDLRIGGIRCASCVWLTEKVLERTRGVIRVRVNYATHRARIRWSPSLVALPDILRRIADIGYQPRPYDITQEGALAEEEHRRLFTRLGTALFFSMQLMLYSVALYAGYFQDMSPGFRQMFHLVALVLATPVVFYSGWPFFSGAFLGLRQGMFNMDVLIAAGSGTAYLFSVWQTLQGNAVYFDTAAMIVTFVLLGRYIEFGAKRHSIEAVSRLLQLVPETATRLIPSADGTSGGLTETVSLESVRTGDILDVRPGGPVPLDGLVVEGISEVDESMLTGEARPVTKTQGCEVFAGTVNLLGALRFRVSRVGRDTALSRIVSAVQDGQARHAPLQKTADRITEFFVPTIILLAALTFLGWWLSGKAAPDALMISVSVIVIACPCALGLATPLAVLVGTGRAAAAGVILKGGDTVEEMARAHTVLFDKTGTLTTGKPRLVSSSGLGLPAEDLLRIGASLERFSEHPYGRAIHEAGAHMELLPVEGFLAVPGSGVEGRISGQPVWAGTRRYLQSMGVDMGGANPEAPCPEGPGSSVVYLAAGGRLAGIFRLSDRVRPQARETVHRLKSMGMETLMLTGDAETVAQHVASDLDLDDVHAGLSPTAKAEVVRTLRSSGRRVLMVGDGINDAPALTEANVGMAVGGANDIALESSDAVMLREDLELVPRALELARHTYRIIRQNLFWAFAYNMLALPLAVSGMLHPVMAAAAMALSSVTVVGNSLRLGRL